MPIDPRISIPIDDDGRTVATVNPDNSLVITSSPNNDLIGADPRGLDGTDWYTDPTNYNGNNHDDDDDSPDRNAVERAREAARRARQVIEAKVEAFEQRQVTAAQQFEGSSVPGPNDLGSEVMWESDAWARARNNPVLNHALIMMEREPSMFFGVIRISGSVAGGLARMFPGDFGYDEELDDEAVQVLVRLAGFVGNTISSTFDDPVNDRDYSPRRGRNTGNQRGGFPSGDGGSQSERDRPYRGHDHVSCDDYPGYRCNDEDAEIPLYMLDLEGEGDFEDFIARVNPMGRPVIFLVHGLNEDSENRPSWTNLNSTSNYREVAGWFNSTYGTENIDAEDLPILIGVQWESGTPLDYQNAQETLMPEAGEEFGRFMAEFSSSNPRSAINIIAHSLGNPMSLTATEVARQKNGTFAIANFIGLQPAIDVPDVVSTAADDERFANMINNSNIMGRVVMTYSIADIANLTHVVGDAGPEPSIGLGGNIGDTRLEFVNIADVSESLLAEDLYGTQSLPAIAFGNLNHFYRLIRHSGMTTKEGQRVILNSFGSEGEFFSNAPTFESD
ncbi:MAG: hypothetical protein AAF653_07860 [Chloroflexota bacterium]